MTEERRDQLHARGVLVLHGDAGVYRCKNEACLTVWRSTKGDPYCPRGCRFRDTGLVINMVADWSILARVTDGFLQWIDLFVENVGVESAADDPEVFRLYGFYSAYSESSKTMRTRGSRGLSDFPMTSTESLPVIARFARRSIAPFTRARSLLSACRRVVVDESGTACRRSSSSGMAGCSSTRSSSCGESPICSASTPIWQQGPGRGRRRAACDSQPSFEMRSSSICATCVASDEIAPYRYLQRPATTARLFISSRNRRLRGSIELCALARTCRLCDPNVQPALLECLLHAA
jgi:hypothetical protein